MDKKENTMSVEALADSGALASMLSYDLAVKLDIEILDRGDATLKDASNKYMDVSGRGEVIRSPIQHISADVQGPWEGGEACRTGGPEGSGNPTQGLSNDIAKQKEVAELQGQRGGGSIQQYQR